MFLLQPLASAPAPSFYNQRSQCSIVDSSVWLFLPIPLAKELYKADLDTALHTAESYNRLPASVLSQGNPVMGTAQVGLVPALIGMKLPAFTLCCMCLVCHILGVGILVSPLCLVPSMAEH